MAESSVWFRTAAQKASAERIGGGKCPPDLPPVHGGRHAAPQSLASSTSWVCGAVSTTLLTQRLFFFGFQGDFITAMEISFVAHNPAVEILVGQDQRCRCPQPEQLLELLVRRPEHAKGPSGKSARII